MILFLDTANLNELKEAMHTGIVKGITTNQTILKREGKSHEQSLLAMKEFYAELIFLQAVAVFYKDGANEYN